MRAKQMFSDKGDAIGLQNLIESQAKYSDLANHTIPEIRAILGNVAQTIYQLGTLCDEEGLTRDDKAQVIMEAFPSMDKNDRSKMKIYHENFDAITAHFNGRKSTSISVDYMVKAWSKSVKEAEAKDFDERTNPELKALLKNKTDVRKAAAKVKQLDKQRKDGTLTSPVNAQDHLINLAHCLSNVERFGKSGKYTNEEIDNMVAGVMDFAENMEKCKVVALQVVNG